MHNRIAALATLVLFFSACADEDNKPTKRREAGADTDDSTDPSSDDDEDDDETGSGKGGSDAGRRVDSGSPRKTDSGSGRDSGAGADSGSRLDSGLGLDSGLAGDAGHAGDSGPPGDASGPVGTGEDPAFEACLATVEPNCNVREKDTAEKIEGACKDLTFIPIPLTDGSAYGPKTLVGGPYGGKIDWNEGAGTEFVGNDNSFAEQICLDFGIDTFAQPAEVTDDIKNLRDIDWTLFTIFRPACMKEGEKYPVITWANGTCGETHGYSGLLGTLSSHGFVVIASNSTWTGSTTTADGTPVQVSALDYAEALNADPESPLYQRLDMERVGAMGHSQGAGATGSTASDPRVKSLIFWNSGTSNEKPFLNVSGDEDFTAGAQALQMATEAATQPGAWIYYHQVLPTGGMNTGHLLLMEQPDRVIDLTVAWWKWQLNDDQDAKKMFVGDDCGLCNSPDAYEYGHNSLLQ